MKNTLYLFAIVAVLLSGCMTVPDLVTSDAYKSEYVGKPLKVLIDEFGLPTNAEETDEGGKISTWELGTETSSVGVYVGYGVSTGSSTARAKRMTAYSDPAGIITDLRASGFEFGNQAEVQAAQKTNTYLGVIYASGLLSLFYLMSL